MTLQTRTDDRRTMVRQIAEHLQLEPSYQGPPSFAYAVGPITVARDGSITCEDAAMLEALKPFLVEKGYLEQEVEMLTITVPTDGMNGLQLRNLVHMLHSYQHLLNRVTRQDSFDIPQSVITRLGEYVPETVTDFETLMNDFKAMGELSGVDFKSDTVSLAFPLEESSDKNRAYTDLVSAMVKAARGAKRVSAVEHRPDNEKYVLRAWLMRLGLGGDDFKVTRKALLDGLQGHTAFRDDAGAKKHREKYAEIRRIAHEAKEGEAQ